MHTCLLKVLNKVDKPSRLPWQIMFVNTIQHCSVETLLSVAWHRCRVFILNHSHLERKKVKRITEEHTALRTSETPVWKALITITVSTYWGEQSDILFLYLETRSKLWHLTQPVKAASTCYLLRLDPSLGTPRGAVLIVRAKTQGTPEPTRRVRTSCKVTVDASVHVITAFITAGVDSLPGGAACWTSDSFKAGYPHKASGVGIIVSGRVERESGQLLGVGGVPAAEGAGCVIVRQPVVTLLRHPQRRYKLHHVNALAVCQHQHYSCEWHRHVSSKPPLPQQSKRWYHFEPRVMLALVLSGQ